jgi:hypothetical protein
MSQLCPAGLPCLLPYVCRTEPLADGEQPEAREGELLQAVGPQGPGPVEEGSAVVRVNPQAESGNLEDVEAESWSPLAVGKSSLLTDRGR